VCATDEPVEENTVDLPEDHDGVKVRKAGSKRPASKKVQQEGKKRVRSVQIKASEHNIFVMFVCVHFVCTCIHSISMNCKGFSCLINIK
jgi:hypothetical protein